MLPEATSLGKCQKSEYINCKYDGCKCPFLCSLKVMADHEFQNVVANFMIKQTVPGLQTKQCVC